MCDVCVNETVLSFSNVHSERVGVTDVTNLQAAVESSAGTRVDDIAEVLAGQVEQLIEVNAAVGKLSECSLSLDLWWSCSCQPFCSDFLLAVRMSFLRVVRCFLPARFRCTAPPPRLSNVNLQPMCV